MVKGGSAMPQYPREQPIIEVKNIRKEYPLEEVNLAIQDSCS